MPAKTSAMNAVKPLNEMPGLTFRERGGGPGGARWALGKKIFHKARFVKPATVLVITPEGFGGESWIQCEYGSQVFKQQLHEAYQGDAVRAAQPLVEPVAPPQESVEWGGVRVPDERGGVTEIAAVAHEVPVFGEAPQPLHGGKIDEAVAEDFVG